MFNKSCKKSIEQSFGERLEPGAGLKMIDGQKDESPKKGVRQKAESRKLKA